MRAASVHRPSLREDVAMEILFVAGVAVCHTPWLHTDG